MIEWSRVNQLKEEVGIADFEEIVAIFIEEVDQVVERLRSAPEPARLAADMHFLRGSALNMGFKALGAECSLRECQVLTNGSAEIDLGPVIRIYEESRAVFLRTLAGPAPLPH